MRKRIFLALVAIGLIATRLAAQADVPTTDFTMAGYGAFCADQRDFIHHGTLFGGVDFYLTPANAGGKFAFGIGMNGGQLAKYETRVKNDLNPDSTIIRTANSPILSGMVALCLPAANPKLKHWAGRTAILDYGISFPWGYRSGTCHSFKFALQVNYSWKAAKSIRMGVFLNGGYFFGWVPDLVKGPPFVFDGSAGIFFTLCNINND